MLQFEFDIRSHKTKSIRAKGKQLAAGLALIITAVVLFIFVKYLDVIPLCNYFVVLIIAITGVYIVGLLLGCKFMYPREYLKINSRKIKYKRGWLKGRTKIYRKDVKEFRIIKQELIVLTKEQEEYRFDISDFSDDAILVLKGYLNIE